MIENYDGQINIGEDDIVRIMGIPSTEFAEDFRSDLPENIGSSSSNISRALQEVQSEISSDPEILQRAVDNARTAVESSLGGVIERAISVTNYVVALGKIKHLAFQEDNISDLRKRRFAEAMYDANHVLETLGEQLDQLADNFRASIQAVNNHVTGNAQNISAENAAILVELKSFLDQIRTGFYSKLQENHRNLEAAPQGYDSKSSQLTDLQKRGARELRSVVDSINSPINKFANEFKLIPQDFQAPDAPSTREEEQEEQRQMQEEEERTPIPSAEQRESHREMGETEFVIYGLFRTRQHTSNFHQYSRFMDKDDEMPSSRHSRPLYRGKIDIGQEINLELDMKNMLGVKSLALGLLIRREGGEKWTWTLRDLPERIQGDLPDVEGTANELKSLKIGDAHEKDSFGWAYIDVNSKVEPFVRIIDKLSSNTALNHHESIGEAIKQCKEFSDDLKRNYREGRYQYLDGLKHKEYNRKIDNLISALHGARGDVNA